jgi:hypothetical protein
MNIKRRTGMVSEKNGTSSVADPSRIPDPHQRISMCKNGTGSGKLQYMKSKKKRHFI